MDVRFRVITSDPVADAKILRAVVTSLRTQRPRLGPSQLIAEPITSIGDLMEQTALVDTVVATRFHTVLSALKLAKPTLALSYGIKSDSLMADMGMADFCLPVRSFEVEQLIEKFKELEGKSTELRPILTERSAVRESLVARQFTEMSQVLFGSDDVQHLEEPSGPVEPSRPVEMDLSTRYRA